MSATMARQGGRVELDQSDMRLALNMSKVATGGFSCHVIEEKHHPIKIPLAELREEMKRGVEFHGHEEGKAAIEWHPAMVYENQTDSCLPCHNGTARNPRTRWRPKGTGAPPQVQCKEPTPELTPTPPITPPAQSGDTSAKNISVQAECLRQSGHGLSEPSATPRLRITPRPASIPRVA